MLKRDELNGPVLKTVVNRAPRSAGRVVEVWDGMDESGAMSVSDVFYLINFLFANGPAPV